VRNLEGQYIELEGFAYDVRAGMDPEIIALSSVQELARTFSITFPWSAYHGHFKEKGYQRSLFSGRGSVLVE